MLRNLAACLLLALLVTAGCDCHQALDAQTSAARDRLLLMAEPAGAIGIIDARESLTAEPAKGAEQDLVVVGRIGGSKPVFSSSHASFFLVDPSAVAAHDHADGCGENCPYCSKGADENAVAMIHCVDARGEPLKVSADRLLGLAAGQTAVIQGRAQLDESGNLVVMAEGIYVRR